MSSSAPFSARPPRHRTERPQRSSKTVESRTGLWLGAAVVLAFVAIIALIVGLVTADDSDSAQDPSAAALSRVTPSAGKPVPSDLSSESDLPAGGPFTARGKGTFRIVPVDNPAAVNAVLPQRMRSPEGLAGNVPNPYASLINFSVEVENGLDATHFGEDRDFRWWVRSTLADVRGWSSGGKRQFIQVDGAGNKPLPAGTIRITLASPLTTRQLCGYNLHAETSCWQPREGRVVINLARYVRGASTYPYSLQNYRRYLINHELGHALGFAHEICPSNGAAAPVMMQQTLSLSNRDIAKLEPVLFSQLPSAATDPASDDLRSARCRPNPWPNPENLPDHTPTRLPLTRG